MTGVRVALMTGTGQGIGKGCAVEMAKAGYKVSLMSPSTRSKDLAEELGGTEGEVQERAVDVQITRLRRKIEQDPKNPRYLQTVRGAGYMLTPD